MVASSDQKATLDKIFRKGSQARKIADLMLDGKPHSRQDLAEKVGTSATQIPRVKRMVEDAGIEVATSIGADGRSTIYQLAAADGRESPKERGAGSQPVLSIFIERGRFEVETVHGSYVVTFHDDGTVTAKTPKQEITIV